jgi:phenylalanyl-tRNA synthetase beta chain
MLGMVLAGEWRMASWVGPAQIAEVADLKGVVEVLVDRLHAGRVEYAQTAARPMVEHPGRTAAVMLAGDTPVEIGHIGELDPRYVAANDLRTEHVVVALLDLAALNGRANAQVRIEQASKLPAVERDIAVVVKASITQGQVAAAIRMGAADALSSLSLFDRYQGPPLGADEVSLAYRLRFAQQQRAPSEDEIDAVMVRVARELGGLGARIRGPEDS